MKRYKNYPVDFIPNRKSIRLKNYDYSQQMGRCKIYCRGNPCGCPKIKRKITEVEIKIVGATLAVAQK